MNISNQLRKLVSVAVITSLSSFSLYMPSAQAAMVGTAAALGAPAITQHGNRAQLLAQLNRHDVQEQLMARGVDPEQVRSRVNALSDAEAHSLALQLDQLPAGAGALEVVALVFIILILTDIAGITHIFTFVR